MKKFLTIASAMIAVATLYVTAQGITLDDVPYNTPMWSQQDPFGFDTMNVVTVDLSKIKGDIVVITNDMSNIKGTMAVVTNDIKGVKGTMAVVTNDIATLKLYGPRISAIEARTNVWDDVTFKSITASSIVSAISGSGATLFDSVLIGDRAGNSIVAGSVIAIGRDALRRYDSGKTPETLGNDRARIVAIGENAGEDAYTTFNAVAIGDNALQDGSARFSTAIGSGAGKRGTLYNSVAVGGEAGAHQADLEHATVIGSGAGRGAVGAHVTALGADAARNYTGTNVVTIGAGVGKDASGDNKLFIDSSGVNDGANAELSMIYGDGINLTLGRVGSSNTLRGDWSIGGHALATTNDIPAVSTLAGGLLSEDSDYTWRVQSNDTINVYGQVPVMGQELVTAVAPIDETTGNSSYLKATFVERATGTEVEFLFKGSAGWGGMWAGGIVLPDGTPMNEDFGMYIFSTTASGVISSMHFYGQDPEGNDLYANLIAADVDPALATLIYSQMSDPHWGAEATLTESTGAALRGAYEDTDLGIYVEGWYAYEDVIVGYNEVLDTTYDVGAFATTNYVDDALAGIDPEDKDPYQPWTSTIVPVNGTATVVRAHGLYPKLELSGKTVIAIDSDTYPTGGTSAVKLSLFAGANEVELNEENVMYAEPIEISDTEWTTIYFERTSTNTWRAVTW